MGKKIKKGKVGPSKEFISRSKAIKKMQVSLKDFRRLCILKGIYPREPPKSLRKFNKTYYHVKDISYLSFNLKHESILSKFREQKAHMKKIKRAIARGEKLKAAKLKRNTPKYTLDHLIKERYPTFIDALNDLDDPLCLLSLFASFPSHKDLKISNEIILNCQRLIKQFLVYVAQSHSLRKVFLSIKGIYYQANIQGTNVTWIQPYNLTPEMPLDVDYKVMMTFLDFYQTLIKFINFRLLGEQVDFGTNQYIGDVVRQRLQPNKEKFFSIIDEKFQNDEQVKQINKQAEETVYSSLFQGLTFQLSTEVPRQSLEFVILSFGGRVCWSGDNQNINESEITHIVTERTNINFDKKKEYVQPQWIYDSINKLKLISVKEYAPDKVLPPHLSPFEEQQEQLAEEAVEISEEEEQEENEKPLVVQPKFNPQQEEKKVKKLKKLSAEEEKRLAETILTRKNKRLYDMVKRKEDTANEKKKKIKAKKDALNTV